MKVLYIAHYKERSGWGQVSRDQILAMDSVGIDVVPRSLNLGMTAEDIPQRIKELEAKSAQDCDICIQHVLPHYMKYDSTFKKNIGFFELETSNIKLTSWSSHLNLMDEVWVPCSNMIRDCYESGVTKPIRLVPHAIDVAICDIKYPKLSIPLDNKFVFYFIGEYNRRKHLSALLKAFHIEFGAEEPVELVIKVNKHGVSVDSLAEDVKNFCNKIKDGLKLYKDPGRYKPEILITSEISRTDILRLHSSCDCFVMPSYGEAWCAPALDAMAMGNLVIASATGGMLDYIDSERNGFLVSGRVEPVFGQFETFEEFGTAREKWFEISISDLTKTMRRVYEMSNERKNKVRMEAASSVKKYDYGTIGKIMKELLNV